MFKNILENVNGIEIYAVTGLIVFVILFVAVLTWILKVDKKYIQKMEHLPLDNNFKEKINLTGELNDK